MFLKSYIFQKKFKIGIAVLEKIYYNSQVMFLHCMCGDDDRARATETREPCQAGNRAAISGAFGVLR